MHRTTLTSLLSLIFATTLLHFAPVPLMREAAAQTDLRSLPCGICGQSVRMGICDACRNAAPETDRCRSARSALRTAAQAGRLHLDRNGVTQPLSETLRHISSLSCEDAIAAANRFTDWQRPVERASRDPVANPRSSRNGGAPQRGRTGAPSSNPSTPPAVRDRGGSDGRAPSPAPQPSPRTPGEWLANDAASAVGSDRWSTKNGPLTVAGLEFEMGRNTCNVFVSSQLFGAGLNVPVFIPLTRSGARQGFHPILAGHWGDAGKSIPGYPVTTTPPRPGDIVAARLPPGSTASGHVGIVTRVIRNRDGSTQVMVASVGSGTGRVGENSLTATFPSSSFGPVVVRRPDRSAVGGGPVVVSPW